MRTRTPVSDRPARPAAIVLLLLAVAATLVVAPVASAGVGAGPTSRPDGRFSGLYELGGTVNRSTIPSAEGNPYFHEYPMSSSCVGRRVCARVRVVVDIAAGDQTLDLERIAPGRYRGAVRIVGSDVYQCRYQDEDGQLVSYVPPGITERLRLALVVTRVKAGTVARFSGSARSTYSPLHLEDMPERCDLEAFGYVPPDQTHETLAFFGGAQDRPHPPRGHVT